MIYIPFQVPHTLDSQRVLSLRDRLSSNSSNRHTQKDDGRNLEWHYLAPARLTGFQDYKEFNTEKKVPVLFNLGKFSFLFLQSLCLLGFTLLPVLFLTSSRLFFSVFRAPRFVSLFFINSISSLAMSGDGVKKAVSQGRIYKILFNLSGFLLAHTAPWWQNTKTSAIF